MKSLNIKIIFKISMAVFTFLWILPDAAFAQKRLSVNVSIANMRSGPGSNHDVLWQTEQYHPVQIIKKQNDWYQIKDYENDRAWIHKSLLSNIPCAITIKDKCNVRSKPDKKSRILFVSEKGVPFKVIGKKGNWIKIEHSDGDVGWIYKTLVW